jgi:hypothetical protein
MFENTTLYKELKRVRKLIEEERVSYGDILFLQEHQTEVKEWFGDDVILCQWAGIEEED